MSGPRIKLSSELYQTLSRCARAAGYSSTDEFVRHTLEKAAATLESAETEEQIRERLRGLGYLG